MKGKTSMFKLLSVLICLLMGLTLLNPLVYAAEESELKDELEKAYQELQATDPEAAEEFIREYREAVKSGEITLERPSREAVKERKEQGGAEGERRYNEADSRKMEGEFNALLKEGKTPQEAEKMMREKYGERDGQQGPPDFDLSKPEERAMALERLDKDSAFLKERGLSDDDLSQLKDAIARGDKDAEIFDKMDEMGLGPPDPGDERIFGPERFGPERFGPEMERFGPPEGMERFGPPEGMERYGPEGGREFSKEDMMEHFKEEMGREPNEWEREMMEKAEFDRPDFDRPEFDRPEFERPDFDRPDYEKPDREYEYRELPPSQP